MEEFEAKFTYEKSTKNTHRYQEQAEDGKPEVIGTLYVQKWAVGGNNPAKAITVKVTPTE